jgi:hypothetical protein
MFEPMPSFHASPLWINADLANPSIAACNSQMKLPACREQYLSIDARRRHASVASSTQDNFPQVEENSIIAGVGFSASKVLMLPAGLTGASVLVGIRGL